MSTNELNVPKEVFITTEFITLGQFLKYVGLIENGSMAKEFLLQNKIYVNNELENRRGRKLYKNSTIFVNGEFFVVSR